MRAERRRVNGLEQTVIIDDDGSEFYARQFSIETANRVMQFAEWFRTLTNNDREELFDFMREIACEHCGSICDGFCYCRADW